jgi:hypothetical protein
MEERRRRHRFTNVRRVALVVSAFLIGISALVASRAIAQNEDGAGLVFSGKATDNDVGLPIYPGAKPHKDTTSDESAAARMGLWGGGVGFKLAVMKMESIDSQAKVADFYRKALARYGRVLDCTEGAAGDPGKDGSSGALTCADDKPDKGGMLFKAGTKEKQHIVSIEPNGKGTNFALIYLWVKGD